MPRLVERLLEAVDDHALAGRLETEHLLDDEVSVSFGKRRET
jgi:hypothetical protein